MTEDLSRQDIQAEAEKIRPQIERVAEAKGWYLNSNKDITDSILEGLARNKLLRGKKYCPCRLPSGDLEKDKIYICPCRDSAKDVESEGHCHCYLYMKEKEA